MCMSAMPCHVRVFLACKLGGSFGIRVGKSHKLAEFVGYSVAKASLVQDPAKGARLILTLAEAAGHP
jgi:hypothetical protein